MDAKEQAEKFLRDNVIELGFTEHAADALVLGWKEPIAAALTAAEQRGASRSWQYGNPPEAGYYLACWLDHRDKPCVSEMWWGPNDKWMYRGHGIDPITVYAWGYKPQPAPPPTADGGE